MLNNEILVLFLYFSCLHLPLKLRFSFKIQLLCLLRILNNYVINSAFLNSDIKFINNTVIKKHYIGKI